MRKDLMKLTAVELGKKIKDKEVTVVEATKACLERIKALDETYNCFVTVDEAGALAQAEAIQAKIDSGELTGPLAGVPVAIKDNMCINGMLTSCSSKILSNFVPTYTATAVEKLQEAGAELIAVDETEDIGELLSDKDKNHCLIFLCRTGRRADEAAEYARSHGFRQAYSAGGREEWAHVE